MSRRFWERINGKVFVDELDVSDPNGLTVGGSGIVSGFASLHGCSTTLGLNWTELEFDVIETGSDLSFVDGAGPYKLKAPATGYYRVSIAVIMSVGSPITELDLFPPYHGDPLTWHEVLAVASQVGPVTTFRTVSAEGVFYMEAGDIFGNYLTNGLGSSTPAASASIQRVG